MEPVSTEKRQQALMTVARELSRTENVEQLLDQILECSREVMDCEVCSILLPEPDSGDLLIRSTNDAPGQAPIRVPQGKGIAGYVFESKLTVNLEDAQMDPRHFAEAGSAIGLVTRNMLTIPLLDGDRSLGAMQAINSLHRAKFTDADEGIFETFGALIAVTLIRLDAHQNAIREAEVRQQLDLAQEIQASFLPAAQARFGHLQLNSLYEPAAETGGDFFFWHVLEDDHLLLGIGDVCGKGFPAALDMARGTTLITSLSHRATWMPLNEWVGQVNGRLCDVMSAGRFIATAFLLINQRRRTVSVCLCGALPPKILVENGWLDVPTTPNPPLGVSCALNFRSETYSLAASPTWMILSDGILETQNQQGEYFEDGAFDIAMADIASRGEKDVLGSLRKAWREFAPIAAYQDDTTVLILDDEQERPPVEFEFSCSPDSIVGGRKFVDDWAKFCGFDEETTGLIVLGCDEILTNICKHAYCEADGRGPVRIHARARLEGLEFQVVHQGDGISEEELPDTKPEDLPRAGGMGVCVIRQIFDEVNFEKGDDSSRVTVCKHVNPLPAPTSQAIPPAAAPVA